MDGWTSKWVHDRRQQKEPHNCPVAHLGHKRRLCDTSHCLFAVLLLITTWNLEHSLCESSLQPGLNITASLLSSVSVLQKSFSFPLSLICSPSLRSSDQAQGLYTSSSSAQHSLWRIPLPLWVQASTHFLGTPSFLLSWPWKLVLCHPSYQFICWNLISSVTIVGASGGD